MTRNLFVIATFGSVLWTFPAKAGQQDRFWLETGTFISDVDSTLQLSNPQSENGTILDVENDLGMEDDSVSFDVKLGATLSDRWFVEGGFYSVNRSGKRVIDRTIEVENVLYDLGADVESSLDSDIYRFTLGYNVINKGDIRLAAVVGAHVTDFEASISGNGSINNGAAELQQRRRTVLAPLPTVGLMLNYQIAKKTSLGVRADYFSLKSGDFKGRIFTSEFQLLHELHKNIGLGLAYRHADYRLDIDKENYAGSIRYRFAGPRLFVLLKRSSRQPERSQ